MKTFHVSASRGPARRSDPIGGSVRTANAPTSELRGVNAGLLVLRVGVGLSLLLLFGWPKLHDAWQYFHTGRWTFVDFNRKMGLPIPVVAACVQTLNESVGAALVACGFLGRSAAGALAFGFVVAATCSWRAGEAAWLTAAYFALMFATLLLTGPGAFALDALLESRRQAARATT
jgi:uncharacterized membrane protein YphA (DoxX/SURF4 family)